jgi:hypothetical protein
MKHPSHSDPMRGWAFLTGSSKEDVIGHCGTDITGEVGNFSTLALQWLIFRI